MAIQQKIKRDSIEDCNNAPLIKKFYDILMRFI